MPGRLRNQEEGSYLRHAVYVKPVEAITMHESLFGTVFDHGVGQIDMCEGSPHVGDPVGFEFDFLKDGIA